MLQDCYRPHMRIFMILLALLMAPVESAAREKPIILYATDPSPVLQEMAQEFEAAGVPLKVQNAHTKSCQQAKKNAPAGAFIVCAKHLAYSGWTTWYGNRTIVRFNPRSIDNPNTVCHELMHAITHIDDGGLPDQEASCVWGEADHLTPWDIEYIKAHRVRS